jgi:hypothetical protein
MLNLNRLPSPLRRLILNVSSFVGLALLIPHLSQNVEAQFPNHNLYLPLVQGTPMQGIIHCSLENQSVYGGRSGRWYVVSPKNSDGTEPTFVFNLYDPNNEIKGQSSNSAGDINGEARLHPPVSFFVVEPDPTKVTAQVEVFGFPKDNATGWRESIDLRECGVTK